MKTKETLKNTKTEQKINLINGCFTVSEASDIVSDILKVKINFHKLQSLSITEGNINDPCEYDNTRINELLKSQQTTKEFFKDARLSGKKLKINSVIQISIED